MPSSVSFGVLLRQARLAAELTQLGLAERAGLSVRAVQHLEAARGKPYPDTARRLADALNLSGAEREAFESRGARPPRPVRRADHAMPSVPNNLPRYLTSFVGRDDARLAIGRLLRGSQLVTLVGSGGCGKTRLAVAVGAALVGDYAHGVWLVELASLTDAALMAQQVASVLGLPQIPGQSLDQLLANALCERQLLLILDNCEHLVDTCASLLRELLPACPGLRVLATSRVVLGVGGETVWRVPSLSLPSSDADLLDSEAARLLLERAGWAAQGVVLAEAARSAVARICRRLDGIPLALELAAARLRGMGVADLAARLDDCLGLLVEADAGRPPRQQTAEAAIDWSYVLLSSAEQSLLAQLSAFSGGFTLEAVESVCAISGSAAVDVLQRLIEGSLVVGEPRPDGSMRYRLLETIRQYAARRLGACTDEVRTRHARYYAGALARVWPPTWWGHDLQTRLSAVEQELDNVRAALRWLIGVDDRRAALSIGYALGPFWLLTARVSEGRAWLAELAALAGPDVIESSGVYAWLGGLLTQDGELARARAPLERGLALAREHREELAQAFALMWLGIWASLSQQPALAREYASEGLEVSRAGGYRALDGLNLRVLAQIAVDEGDLDRAWSLAEQSLAAGREAGHPPSTAWALNALGLVAFSRGEFAAAERLLRQSFEQGRNMAAPAIQQSTLVYLAWAALHQLHMGEAFEFASRSLQMGSGVLGGHGALALPLEAFAQIAAATDQPLVAVRLAGAASARRETYRAPIRPTQRAQLESWLARAQAAMPPSLAEAARLEGTLLSDEEAASLASTLISDQQPLARLTH